MGFIAHEIQPDFYYLPDEEYIKYFREGKRRYAEEDARQHGYDEEDVRNAGEFAYNFHSDEVILNWRNTIKQLHENPDLKFGYVQGIDSVCERCEHRDSCSNPNHENFKIVEQTDNDAIKLLSELKFDEIYDEHYLRKFVSRIQNALEKPQS